MKKKLLAACLLASILLSTSVTAFAKNANPPKNSNNPTPPIVEIVPLSDLDPVPIIN